MVVGLCLAVTFALSVIVAYGAQAASYERCVPQKKGMWGADCFNHSEKKGSKARFELEPVGPCVAQKKGRYSESKCETRDERKGKPKGSYELTKERGFTEMSGRVKWETPSFLSIECTASTAAGEITGPKTAVERFTLTNCTYEGAKCESSDLFGNGTPSGTPGTIVTNLLDATLIGPGEKAGGYRHEEPKSGEVWDELLSAEHEPYVSEFTCGGEIVFRTSGSVSGPISPVGMASLSAKTIFSVGTGEQASLIEEFNDTEFIPHGGAPISWEGVPTRTYEQQIEIVS
jgi:hypothetical protein